MSSKITVPFTHLVMYHNEIGVHRGREAGFGEVFGLKPLGNLLFTKLARPVKDAYTGKRIPSHEGWPDQREALRWFIDQGREAILAMGDSKPVKVRPCRYQRYYIFDGHHRALALFILGDHEIRAKIKD